jgi:nucleotide-binding universal stress UspA family protein
MYNRILVPLDGSPTSERGFEEAVALARVMKSTLLLVNVVDTVPMAIEMATTTTWQEICEGMRKRGQGLLDRARLTAADHGVSSETLLVEARAERVADTLVDEARNTKCDLVVMGTHGRRGFSHALLGSDAERLVRQCPVPVLLVRHPDAATA